jgi:phospholipid/cholesterol/gamma-HCH transport system substrate-binding protein
MARAAALTGVALLLAALGALIVTSRPSLTGGEQVKAEFHDVYPLLEGMDVREYGALAGTVQEIEVTDRGTVLVTVVLTKDATRPRADAAAAIRQQDVTGNSYLALSPGDAAEPLGDRVIPMSRTLVAPRFEDLLNALDKPVQQGMQIILAQLGVMMDRRGEDLNRAALTLRPALSAAHQALTEVASQNRTLRALISDAEHVTGQVAGSSRQLGGLVDSLASTARTTADHAPALDRALAAAPRTADAAAGTLARLTRVAVAGRPLARTLGRASPEIVRTARAIGPFLDDVPPILTDAESTLQVVRKLLTAAEPTLAAAPKRALTAPFDVAGSAGKLLNTLLGNEDLLPGLFGASDYGKGPAGNTRVGLGAMGVETGNQAGYPGDYDPLRYFLRAVAIPSCESFGLPIKPGCLAAAAGQAPASRRPAEARRPAAALPERLDPTPLARPVAPQRLPVPQIKLPEALERPIEQARGLLDFLLKP